MPDEEKAAYLADWSAPGALTAMLNWYRASDIVVPAPGEAADGAGLDPTALPARSRCRRWSSGRCGDKALLPVQLDGLDDLIDDLRIVTVPDAGHFIPWEKPAPVVARSTTSSARPGALDHI